MKSESLFAMKFSSRVRLLWRNHKVTLSSGENVQSENEIMSTQCSSSSFYAICTIRFQFVSGHWESDSKSASRSNSFFFWKSSWIILGYLSKMGKFMNENCYPFYRAVPRTVLKILKSWYCKKIKYRYVWIRLNFK